MQYYISSYGCDFGRMWRNNTVTLPSSEADSVRQEGKEIENQDAKHLVLTTTALDPEVAPDYNPWADGLVKFKRKWRKTATDDI